MSGFIYLWRDRKRGMYYLGSHFGSPDDGYVCGSKRMKFAYKKRPSDFQRRLIEILPNCSRKELFAAEQRWLDLIKISECGCKYYNIGRKAVGADPVLASAWMKGNQHGKGKSCSPETRKKISDAQKGKCIPESQKEKMRRSKKGRTWFTDGTNDRLCWEQPSSEWIRGRAKMRGVLSGRRRSHEIREKVSAAKTKGHAARRLIYGTGHSPETIEKIRATKLRQYAEKRSVLL